ncbi:hypothetical protein CXB51_003850 [Gossypium anomalum]|uniref:Reverse transcriptase zinc-binding domain-containing protein n=1 Tax=Gossypium anomalum TaxID=47600 RepID=A0A8J5ZJ62_9ROSI|nr:hypothetical protein CXB51_003850 [Gossypium anomalum]
MAAEWQPACPQRIKVFLWLPFQNKLLANRIRVHRHVAMDARFVACGDPTESIDHKQQNRGIFDVDSVVGGCLIHQTRRLWANSSWLKVNTERARNEEPECAVVDLRVLCRIMMVFR